MVNTRKAILVLLVGVVLLTCGCAGRKEAHRTALLLVDATDTYIKEVSQKIKAEQNYYDQAREDFETQLKNEEEKNKVWETKQPSFEILDFVEQLVRDEGRLQVPGDFYGVLLEVNRLQEERAKKIAQASDSFIYYVSLRGVTGARKSLPSDILKNMKALKRVTHKPVLIGFGVSSPQQSHQLGKMCQGVIVGSAIVQELRRSRGVIQPAVNFVRKMVKALKA